MSVYRLETSYKDHSERFLVKSFDYQKQFCHMYAKRLAEMTELLKKPVREKWGDKYPIKKLCELREEQQETCIIIGTIYKHQTHKPSILREISEENQLAPQPPREHYADPEDKLILEDELQRVRLFGSVQSQMLATGIVCAVLGTIEEDGRFIVTETLFYEGGPQRSLVRSKQEGIQRLLVLCSGLNMAEAHLFDDALNLFQHWLAGNLTTESSKQIVRLMIAGNSVRNAAEQRPAGLITSRPSDSHETVRAMLELDGFLVAWSRMLPVDIMPGAFDPANFMLPQQPFHQCMLPKASKHKSFRAVSNPYSCEVDDALIIGCSGQNINDLLRCTMIDDPLQALRSTLLWSHLAPTAPDTLACYPYVNSDPLILRECPHVYFAGNCDAFATEMHIGSHDQRTRLVCVPKFAATQSVAVVDLDTLDCYQVQFKA